MSEQNTFEISIHLTIRADNVDRAMDFAFEAASLADGQGLMDHRSETIITWSVEGPESYDYTACEKCGLMNIPIVEGMAPEFCDDCD